MLTQALYYSRSTTPLAWVVPDDRWSKMWRVRQPDGSTSDMLNLARAKDAAAAIPSAVRLNVIVAASVGRLDRWKTTRERALMR
jgi:hypothetical protein